MYRVLLIRPEAGAGSDDEVALLRLLTDNGLTVKVAPLGGIADGAETLCYAFDGRPPQLLVADLSAPRTVITGVLPLRHIRRIQQEPWGETADPLPLIALLAPAHLNTREWHPFVDDFLLPPHSPEELATRLRYLLFRRQKIEERDALRFEGVTLRLNEHRAVVGTEPIPLTPREYELLRFLLTHRGRFFSRERLLDFVWGVDYDGGQRTVDIHIRRLRAKLPPDAAAFLENSRGVGYGFGQ
jgi:DNA-binding response OmpR family regulator